MHVSEPVLTPATVVLPAMIQQSNLALPVLSLTQLPYRKGEQLQLIFQDDLIAIRNQEFMQPVPHSTHIPILMPEIFHRIVS